METHAYTLDCPRPSAAGKFLSFFPTHSLTHMHTQREMVYKHTALQKIKIYPGELLPPRRLFHIWWANTEISLSILSFKPDWMHSYKHRDNKHSSIRFFWRQTKFSKGNIDDRDHTLAYLWKCICLENLLTKSQQNVLSTICFLFATDPTN